MKKLAERRKSSFAFLFPNNNNNNNNVECDGSIYEKNPYRRKGSVTPVLPNSFSFPTELKTPPARKNSLTSFLFSFNTEDTAQPPRSKRKSSLSNLSTEEPLSDEEDYICCDVPSPSSTVTPPPQKTSWNRRASHSSPLSDEHLMGRVMRVVVTGSKKCGKTAILRQVACLEDATRMPYQPTLDDTYQVLLEEGDRPREILVFHDTAGLPEYGPVELRRPYIQVADAFVLVYSVVDHESFNRMDLLKKYIEKQFGKDKKEVPIVVLGTMCDLPGRKVDYEFAQNWAHRERVRLFEVTAIDRTTLVDFVHYLGQRHFHPQKETLKFSLSKKLKSEKSNAAILMDF